MSDKANTPTAQPEVNLPLAPESQIANPVLPPDIGEFFSRMEKGGPNPTKVPAEPAKKGVKATAKTPAEPVKPKEPVKPVDNADDNADDDLSDPFLKNILGDEDGDDKGDDKDDKDKKDDKQKSKKTEAKSDELPELPEGDLKGEEAAAKVREAFATQRKKLTAKIATLEKQIAERTGTEAPPEIAEKLTRYEEENKTLKAQLEEQEKFVQLASLESSKIYRETVKAPIEAIKGDIVRIARDNGGADAGVGAGDIYRAIQQGDRTALNTILANLSEADKIEVITLEKEYRQVKTTEKALRENAKVAQDEFEKSNREQQEAAFKQHKEVFDQTLDKAVDGVKRVIPNLFKEVEGADDWNEKVKEANARIASFKDIHPSQLTTVDVATLLAHHAAGGLLKFENDKLRAEVKRLSSRLKQRNANSPGAGSGSSGGGAKSPASGPAAIPSPEEFIASRGRR